MAGLLITYITKMIFSYIFNHDAFCGKILAVKYSLVQAKNDLDYH